MIENANDFQIVKNVLENTKGLNKNKEVKVKSCKTIMKMLN